MASRADSGGSGGGFTALFVRRPILAVVLNSLIVIAGLAALFGVEVRELPDVDRPVITVTTDYDGAAPETVDREVTGVIEGAMGRISGVSGISSRSSFGQSRVTVEFTDGTDLNVAASDARDSIGRVVNQLPDDADEPRIVKADANSDAVIRIGVTSDTMSVEDLTDLVKNTVEDRLIAAPGVADLQVFGGRDRIFRVDVDQIALASRGLTLADVRDALATVAFDSPAGSLTATNQSLVVRTTATVNTPEAFGALMLDQNTRLSDVATVTLGPDTGNSILRSNGQSGLGIGVIRQAESNTLEISRSIREIVGELQKTLPPGVSIFITGDDAVFIDGSIHEVLLTLALSVMIVVAIIYVFLRDLRATLIPSLTIPVALIGALAAIYVAGFSVNILTLLALVLSTGLVVDDAIVVLENIVRRRAQGMGPRAAAVLGTEQVFFAVVATTTTLAAVFVPLSFLPGQAGALFREFGISLAMAVGISAVVALSLCPMMASRMLADGRDHGGHSGLLASVGGALERLYHRTLHAALAAPLVVLALAAILGVTSWFLFAGIRQEVTPSEDRSVVLLRATAPQGVSLDYTATKLREIEARTENLSASGEVTGLFSIAGQGGSDNSGFIIFTLAPWGERERSQQEIAADITRAADQVIGLRVFAVQPNSLNIRGAGQGLQFAVLGSNFDTLADATDELVRKMEANPDFGQVRISYETTQPQLFIKVDREKASDLGVDIDGLGEALQAVLDGQQGGVGLHRRPELRHQAHLADHAGQGPDRPREPVPRDALGGDGADVGGGDAGGAGGRAPADARKPDAGGVDHRLARGRRRAREGLDGGAGAGGPAAAAGVAHRAARRDGNARGDVERAPRDLRLRDPRRLPGAGGAVRELRERDHRHGDGAARARVRGDRDGPDRDEPQRLQPDRAGADGGHHRQERHPDGGVRQPAARPRNLGQGGDRGGLPHPPAAGDDDDGGDDPRRRAAPPVGRRRGGGAPRARVGDRRGAGPRHPAHALPDAGRLSPPRRAVEAAGRGDAPAPGGARRSRAGRHALQRLIAAAGGACADGDPAQMACTATPSAPARSPERAPRSSLELPASIRNSSDANRQ